MNIKNEKIVMGLLKKKDMMNELVKVVSTNLKSGTSGSLTIKSKGDNLEYYHRDKKNNYRYIRKNEIGLIRELAQKSYDIEVLNEARSQIKLIENFLQKYRPQCIQSVWENLSDERKSLVKPWAVPFEEYARQWDEVKFNTNPYPKSNNCLETHNFEIVRSKAEYVIANEAYHLGLHYRYESELILKRGTMTVKIYPDFEVLLPNSRNVVYIEHFGMMDDPEYRKKAYSKLDLYAENGIFEGDRLIVFYEEKDSPLKTAYVNRWLKHLLTR